MKNHVEYVHIYIHTYIHIYIYISYIYIYVYLCIYIYTRNYIHDLYCKTNIESQKWRSLALARDLLVPQMVGFKWSGCGDSLGSGEARVCFLSPERTVRINGKPRLFPG